jgi:hypothetical protein
MRHRSAAELRDLAIDDGSDAALDELTRREKSGEVEAKQAATEVVLAKRRGSIGAARAIRVCNNRAVQELNQSWEAGRMPGIQRDVGHGPETRDEWRRRQRRPSRLRGRAPRRRTNGRTRGSRRGVASSSQASRDGPSDPDESDPEGVRDDDLDGRRRR